MYFKDLTKEQFDAIVRKSRNFDFDTALKYSLYVAMAHKSGLVSDTLYHNLMEILGTQIFWLQQEGFING